MSRTKIATAVLSAAVGVFLLACGAAPTKTVGQPSATPGAVVGAARTAAPPVVYSVPAPADFTLAVNELSRQCFGSAGCNVTFSVALTATTAAKYDPAKRYRLTYRIDGGEDPYTNFVTVTGDQYSYPDSEFISVKNASAKLSAVLTQSVEA